LPDFITAQPPLEFIPPKFNPAIYWGFRSLLPLWMRWRVRLMDVEVENVEQLVQLYRQFQTDKVRFLMAFRHPSATDPYCLFYLLSRSVPAEAKRQQIQLQMPIHAHFIYDRGIPLWAGKPVGWLFSQLGGTPIRRGKVDLPGLRSIRHLFTEGEFPLAAAPEGATNGHTEIVSPIEPGIAQFGFWCVEDLQKANRTETVLILPIGIRYHYIDPPWAAIEQLLGQLEADCGLAPAVDLSKIVVPQPAFTEAEQLAIYGRLLRLGEHLLTLMEQFYSKFYHQPLSSHPPSEQGQSLNEQIAQRLDRLLNAALTVAEQHFGLPAKGSVTDRCRRLEQAGWERIFRDDLDDLQHLPAAERGLADRIAEEADLRLWHMRLVETFVSVTGHYILEKPTVDRLAETLLLLWDTVARLKGGNPVNRPRLGDQRVKITIGEPISVSDRWQDYQTSRRQASATLTQDLQIALEKMIG
jgi:1-acyl-sn-glycerol-3-phosphate acyltransferase